MPWRGADYPGEFPSLGHEIVTWIEHYLRHGPGDVIGEPIEVDDEFYAFIVKAYALDPDDGRRRYRRAFLSRAKGRAKSELAGMIACAEAIGPVRFGGWDAHGEPVGRPVRSPYVRCLATEEGQSGNTFDNVTNMMQGVAEDFGDEYPGIDIGRSAHSSTRVVLHNHYGQIVPSTASAAQKDGGKESFAVFDETHLYNTPELREMHKVVRRNLGKRKEAEPWSMETSTMYRPGENSVAENTHDYAKKINEGKVRERGLLFDHVSAPPETDLADRESLVAGLKVAYGPAAAWMDLDGIVSEIYDPQSDPSDSRRYWLNLVVSSSDSWISHEEWARCADLKVIPDDDMVTLGFDGSVREDSTALVACRVSDGHLELLGCWQKPEGAAGEGWQVDRDAVDSTVAAAMTRFNVVGFYADPAHWQDYLDAWHREYGDKMQVHATRERPLEFWCNRTRVVITALERFREAVVDRNLTHDGDHVLTGHILNARRRYSRSGLTISKEHPSSPRKIDAAMAATLAYEARCDAVAAGVSAKKTRSRRLHRI